MNRFHDSAHQQMRDAAMDVAASEVVANGWDGLQMRAVATRVGVSRQTLYNAFGNKHGLAEATILRLLDTFLEVIDQAVAEETTLHGRWRNLVYYSVHRARDEPFLVAVLTGTSSDELLPLLTSDGEPLITRSRDHLAATIGRHHPDLDPQRLSEVAETITRLIISHVVAPFREAAEVADHAADLAACTLIHESTGAS